MLVTRTRGIRMEGADESTVLWRNPNLSTGSVKLTNLKQHIISSLLLLLITYVFFKKKYMGQSRPLLFIFVLFTSQINYKLKKKRRWSAWDLNPGLQDGRRRRNHGANSMLIVSQRWTIFFSFQRKRD